MRQVDLREGARRQHRAIALFAVLQCWMRGLDGLVLDRRDLQRLIGIERFKAKRVEWLLEDFREFFPHQETFSQKTGSFGSVFISRLPLDDCLSMGWMTDEERIKRIPTGGPRLGLFEIWSFPKKRGLGRMASLLGDSVNRDEGLLVAYLTLLAHGLISPRNLPELPSLTKRKSRAR